IVRVDVEGWPRLTRAHGRTRAAAVLAEIVRRARSALRTVDWIVRLGEEFFLCVLPASGAEGAALAAKRLSDRISASPIEIAPGVSVEPRVRCGSAALADAMDQGHFARRRRKSATRRPMRPIVNGGILPRGAACTSRSARKS